MSPHRPVACLGQSGRLVVQILHGFGARTRRSDLPSATASSPLAVQNHHFLIPTACSDADFPLAERFEDDRQRLVDRVKVPWSEALRGLLVPTIHGIRRSSPRWSRFWERQFRRISLSGSPHKRRKSSGSTPIRSR